MRPNTSRRWLWRWRRNPLRRPSDVIEAWAVLVAAALLVCGGTVAALSTGRMVQRPLQEQHDNRQQTRAVLLGDAPASLSDAAGTSDRRVPVPVRWTAPDGSPRTGTARVAPGREAGEQTVVWTDRAGNLASRPLTALQVVMGAAASGVLAAGLVVVAVRAGYRLLRRRLDGVRAAGWEAAWAQVEPQWSRRRYH